MSNFVTWAGLAQAKEVFTGDDADSQARATATWLKSKGVVDMRTVPLNEEELDKVRY